MGRHTKLLLALFVAVLVAGACGSRLPDQTLKAFDDGILNGGGGRSSSNFAAGSAEPTAGETAVSGETGGETAAPTAGATTEETPTAGAAPAGGEAAPAANCTPSNATSQGVSPREIKVASIVTDSGPLPGATAGSFRGANAYFSMINSQGGVCGRKLTLLKGDDGLDPQRARGEFLRIEPNVLGFVGAFSVADSGFMDLIDKTKVPWASLTVDPSGRKKETVWPKRADDKIATGPWVYLKKSHPDVAKTAVLYSDVAAVKANLDGTVKAIQRAGFELVEPPIPVNVAEPDYTGQVRNLQDKGVDFVYLFSFEINMQVRFARNMKQQHYEPKIKAANLDFNDRFSELLKSDGDGWVSVNLYLPFLDPAEKQRSPAVNDFMTWNQRVYPGQQIDLFNVSGWGAAAYFVEALRRAGGDVNRASILASLAKNEKYDDGGVGVPFDPHTGDTSKCFTMGIHERGQWKRLHPANGLDCETGEVLKFK
jgi:ABC-type branched-subunit amino acid transport system substrate-binding protein